MSTNLEKGEWKGGSDNLTGWRADAVFEGGNRSAETGKEIRTVGEKDAPAKDESELDKG